MSSYCDRHRSLQHVLHHQILHFPARRQPAPPHFVCRPRPDHVSSGLKGCRNLTGAGRRGTTVGTGTSSAVAGGGWILNNPARHKSAMPRHPRRSSVGIQVIEIMQVVKPQLGPVGAVPIRRNRGLALHRQKAERRRPGHRGVARATHPATFCPPQCRRRPLIGRRPMQAKPQPPIDLDRLQMAKGVPIAREDFRLLQTPAIMTMNPLCLSGTHQ